MTSETGVDLVLGNVVVRVGRRFDAEPLGRALEVLEGDEPGAC